MKKVKSVIAIIFFANILNAQYNIKGRIIDESNGKGIEFATIQKEGTNVGCISDSAGNFSLHDLRIQPDSLLFSCIGYEGKRVKIKYIDLTKPLFIALKPTSFELKEVIIKPLNKSLWIGDKKHSGRYIVSLYYTSQETRYFKAPIIPSSIKSFSFYLNEICGINQKVRICIYNADSVKKTPMDDILQANVIINDLKKGWNKVDLSKFNIAVPLSGFFIGLESVSDKNNCCKANRYFDKRIITYHSMVIGCVKTPTIRARKSLFFADYEIQGELRSQKMPDDGWQIDTGRGFDLLYRVELSIN
jgi:hypothetical protein